MKLLQNCDLPPPTKVFVGSENGAVIPSMNKFFSLISGDDSDKSELLNALRLSQTRAREAVRRSEALATERDRLSGALIDEAGRLFAHRLWVRLLEVQVSSLRAKRADGEDDDNHDLDDFNEDYGDGVCVNWVVALAFCLGIAGFALGCKCFV